ncbi:15-hydroxyprostaglandin dehydrogenase [Trichonephila clavipes]|nr:15-hydroxyprostaglandin dehydrogenase [Trichonephila clavipes]
MPQQLIDTLILSMGRLCETCLEQSGEIISPTENRMFLAGHPSQGCFGLQSHCAPCYFFNQASFYPSDFSFNTIYCPEADGPTNLEQPTLNHVQSDTMTSAVLADPISVLQGTNRGSGPAIEESENDVGSLDQFLLYSDEHYLAGKLPLGDHLGKAKAPRPLHQLCGQCDKEQCGGNCTAHQGASTPIHGYHLSSKQHASNTARRSACNFHPDDQASFKLV